jgi:hypothetical protein
MTDTLLLKEILAAVDTNVKELWDASDDDNKKVIKGDLFRLNRYISNVKSGGRETKEHFVLTVNEYFNKHWHTLQQHPKLLWMLLCMCNLNGKVFYHEWIGYKKKTDNVDKKIKFLQELYPNYKMDELELLASMYTDNEITSLAMELGLDEKQSKKLLK